MATYGRRRAYGQHFLKDVGIAKLIAQTATSEAKKNHCRTLLEIGPGKGAITEPILDEILGSGVERFLICERDRELGAYWNQRLIQTDPGVPTQVEIADFLELPEEKWLSSTPLAIASNLPYSAGTAIFTRLAACPEKIPVMVLMFQAEVAKRLRAEPETKAWGRLSVWTQNRWDVRKLVSVSRKAFSPPPDVESEVVVITRRDTPRIPATLTGRTAELWEPLLKACFTHRRKMLRAGLQAGSIFHAALGRSGVDPTKRPEALQWDEWAKIVAALEFERSV